MRYQYSEEQPIDPKLRYRCRHIFTDGHRCGSPALRGQHLCYYHRSSRELPNTSSTARSAEAVHFPMPAIDDRSGIQLAIHHVLARLATNDIDAKRAGLMLYGLQIASANLPRQPRPAAQPAHADAVPEALIEDYTHCPHLGPLAPLELLPEPELAITAETSITTARDPEQSEANPHGPTTNKARHPELSEAQPKDPEILRPSQTTESLPPSAPELTASTPRPGSTAEAHRESTPDPTPSTPQPTPSRGRHSGAQLQNLRIAPAPNPQSAPAPAQVQEPLTPVEDLTLDPAFWDPAIWQTPALNYKGHDPHPPMAP